MAEAADGKLDFSSIFGVVVVGELLKPGRVK
jgi:hypothetical protein